MMHAPAESGADFLALARPAIELDFSERREETSSGIRRIREEMAARGTLRSGMMWKKSFDYLRAEYERRAWLAWRHLARALSATGSPVSLELADTLKNEVEQWLSDPCGDLLEHGAKTEEIVSLGGRGTKELEKARSHAAQKIAAEIEYSVREAARSRDDGPSTTHFNFYRPVGVVQTGPGAFVVASLSPEMRIQVDGALQALRRAVGELQELEESERSQLGEVVEDISSETSRDHPNAPRLHGLLSALATTIQTLGSGKPAYILVKEIAAAFGLGLP